jgi:hypothetical protein
MGLRFSRSSSSSQATLAPRTRAGLAKEGTSIGELQEALAYPQEASAFEVLLMLQLLHMEERGAAEEDVAALTRMIATLQIGAEEVACAGALLLQCCDTARTTHAPQAARLLARLQRMAARAPRACLSQLTMEPHTMIQCQCTSEHKNTCVCAAEDYHVATSMGPGESSPVHCTRKDIAPLCRQVFSCWSSYRLVSATIRLSSIHRSRGSSAASSSLVLHARTGSSELAYAFLSAPSLTCGVRGSDGASLSEASKRE